MLFYNLFMFVLFCSSCYPFGCFWNSFEIYWIFQKFSELPSYFFWPRFSSKLCKSYHVHSFFFIVQTYILKCMKFHHVVEVVSCNIERIMRFLNRGIKRLMYRNSTSANCRKGFVFANYSICRFLTNSFAWCTNESAK